MTKLAEHLKQGAGHAWESLSEGWRELGARASSALTRFRPGAAAARDTERDADGVPGWLASDRWGFMAADVFDDDDRVLVRIEAPGMKREDFDIAIEGDVLSVSGEKRFDRESDAGRYRVLQCAYGSFRRELALPAAVDAAKVKASYRDGVLRIELPKADGARARRIAVKTA
jgi:HSP20 family protein